MPFDCNMFRTYVDHIFLDLQCADCKDRCLSLQIWARVSGLSGDQHLPARSHLRHLHRPFSIRVSRLQKRHPVLEQQVKKINRHLQCCGSGSRSVLDLYSGALCRL